MNKELKVTLEEVLESEKHLAYFIKTIFMFSPVFSLATGICFDQNCKFSCSVAAAGVYLSEDRMLGNVWSKSNAE